MTMKKYYLNNTPLNEYRESILENEKVDQLLNRLSDNVLNTFKILTFDLGTKRDRKPSSIRSKLSDLANAKTVKELTAKILDYADDNDVSDSRYAEAKRFYLLALAKFAESLNRSVELSKAKEEVVIKRFKLIPVKLQNSIDHIASQAEAEEKRKMSLSESLNESVNHGYRGRLNIVKKLLTNLISSAEGKDGKSGYGKDWKRIFIDLDEKRRILDNSVGGFNDREKRALDELEKQIEKFTEEFNVSMIQSANKAIQQIEDDEEVYTTYSDVIELAASGLDYLTRAKTQYMVALKDIKDSGNEKEADLNRSIFPLRRGDSDSDKKLKGSGLIMSIQNALSNGISSAGKLLKSKNAPNGKYGLGTASIIASIQKLSGNKNVNGELDKTLLDDILASDWVSIKDKKAIDKSLDIVREKMNESKLSTVLSIDSFLNEGKLTINNQEFEDELNKQYVLLAGDTKKGVTESGDSIKGGSSAGLENLSKKLRKNFKVAIESDDFLKTDGTLRSSYSTNFIKAWSEAIDKLDDPEDYAYFFNDGGVYNINSNSTSLKTPANWKKWVEFRQINEFDNDDAIEFITNYLKTWSTFGMVKTADRYAVIKNLVTKNDANSNLELVKPYEMMEKTIKNKEVPFVDFSDLEGPIAKAFTAALQNNDKNPDLNNNDFIAINNFLVMLGNVISFDGKKFISAIEWLHGNVISSSVADRVAKDSIVGLSDTDKELDLALGFGADGIKLGSVTDILKKPNDMEKPTNKDLNNFRSVINLKSSENDIKRLLGTNLYRIANDIFPSIKLHLKRMNATEFDEIPQHKPFKCIKSEIK